MKKRLLHVMFLIFVVIGIMACSGGKANAPAPTPTPVPTTPSIKIDGFAAVPVSQDTNPIVVAVNDSFGSSHSDWQNKTQTILDEINAALNRSAGNKVQITATRFMTYLDSNIETMSSNYDVSYFFDPGYKRYFGTTIFLYLYDGVENKPSIFSTSDSFTRIKYASDGRVLIGIWIAYDISNSPLTNLVKGTADYSVAINNVLEEIGHSFGLAAEEFYSYNTIADWTGIAPIIPSFDMSTKFPNDPMCAVSLAYEYNPFYSWLINANANHQYFAEEIPEGIPDIIKVKVVDDMGNPVEGASVKTFAASWKNVFVTDPIPLLDTTTDASGEAVINSDDASTSTYGSLTYAHKFSANVPAKIIKVSYGGKVAGAYLFLYDLEVDYLQNGLNTVTLQLKLE